MTIDAKGNISTISYTDNFGNGTNPDTGASGASGATFAMPTTATNPLGWQSKMQYDFTLGAATGAKDINGVISRNEYDTAGRVFRATGAYGTAYAIVGEMTYPTATSNIATASNQLTETTWKAAKVEYDGFDRPVISSTAEDGKHASQATFTIFSKTIYDGIGRGKFQTNPYRNESSATDGWTRMIYDLAGRVTEVATFSGSPTTTPPLTGTNTNWTGSVQTNYNGVATTVTDQAGKQRRSITNSLGQLSRVDEPDTNSNLGTIANPTQPTNYSYDLLNNLTQVQQIGTNTTQCGGTVSYCVQTRTFVYDSISRLKSATNPEAGTISYIYDANSNLLQKTDARQVVTNYVYDSLNRITQRNYSAPVNLPNYQATPNVTYTYDDVNIANSKGKLTKVSSSVSETRYTQFDNVGRLLASQQITDGQTYSSSYVYNLSGALIEQTYPSGRVVKNSYDIDGDLMQVQSRKANDTFRNYANSFNYTAAGAVSSMRLGNGRWENTVFNSRLQPVQIGLGGSATSTSLWRVNYEFGELQTNGLVDTAKNSGNVAKQTIVVPNVNNNQGFTATHTFSYDSLDRLKQAKEVVNSQIEWQQTFLYDRYSLITTLKRSKVKIFLVEK